MFYNQGRETEDGSKADKRQERILWGYSNIFRVAYGKWAKVAKWVRPDREKNPKEFLIDKWAFEYFWGGDDGEHEFFEGVGSIFTWVIVFIDLEIIIR